MAAADTQQVRQTEPNAFAQRALELPFAKLQAAGNGYIVIDGGLLGEPGSLTTGIEDVGKTNRGHGVTRRVKKRTIQLPVTKTYKYQVEAFGRTITSRAAFPLEPEDGLANIELISQARGW